MRDYPHTTDTERFAVLHDAADALLDELAESYMVERRETKELLGPDEALVRTVRLIPRTPAAAPLSAITAWQSTPSSPTRSMSR